MKQLLCSLLFALFLFSCTNNDSPTMVNNNIDSSIIVKDEKPLDETINMTDFLPQGNPGTEFHYESVERGRSQYGSTYTKDTIIVTILSMNSLTPDNVFKAIKVLTQTKSYSQTYGVEVRTDTVWYGITQFSIVKYTRYTSSYYSDLYVKEFTKSTREGPNSSYSSAAKKEFLFDSKKFVSVEFKNSENMYSVYGGSQSSSESTTTYAKGIGLVYLKSSSSGRGSKFDQESANEKEEKLIKIVRK